MKRAPLVNILLPLIVGILLANWVHFSIGVALIIVLVLFIPLVYLTFRPTNFLYHLVYYPFWIGIGLLLVSIHDPFRHANHYSYYVHPNSIVRAVVAEPPKSSAKSIKVVAEINVYDSLVAQGRIILFVEPSSKANTLSYGDTLIMRISPQQPSAVDNPYQFNYRNYLHHRNIAYQAYLSTSNYHLIQGNPTGIKAFSISLRNHFISNIQQLNLTDSQKGIVEALFLGWDNDLATSSRQQFRDAGLAHLLCVSGLHVGIIAGILGFLLIGLGRGPRMRIVKGILQLSGVWIFAMLTGFAPATTRAALMFTFFIVSQMFLIQRNSYNTLAASALILLFINPHLIYDVGFQLSYSAVLGILSIMPPLYRLIPWGDRALLEAESSTLPLKQRILKHLPLLLSQKLWSLVCLTFSAQLSVLPFTLYYFHQFPTYFLISNLTIVPLAGILLLTIIISVFFLGWTFPAKLLSFELNLIDSVTHWVSQLPYASMSHIYFDVFMLITLVIFLVLLIAYLHTHRKILALLIFIPLLSIVVHARIQQVQAYQHQFFILYDAGRYPAVEFFTGINSTLFTSPEVVENPTLLDYQTENLFTMTHSKRSSIQIIDTTHHLRFGNSTLFIVDSTNQWSISNSHPTYLYLEGNPHLTITHLLQRIQFDTLIFGANNSHYRLSKWSQECDSLNVPYHNIATQGAFVRGL